MSLSPACCLTVTNWSAVEAVVKRVWVALNVVGAVVKRVRGQSIAICKRNDSFFVSTSCQKNQAAPEKQFVAQ